MKSLTDLIEFRTKKLAGVQDDRWMWPKADKGAYAGPFTDWDNSHIHKYFKNVKQKRLVVTAGANMGLYVRAYANMFDHVWAFEPHWVNFYCMSYNCPYDNVYKFQAALGENTTQCNFQNSNPTTNMGAYRIKDDAPEKSIPMMALDDMNLPYVDLIQLDIEGYEGWALKGGQKTIEKHKPVIIVENARPPSADVLSGLGYVLQEKSISDQIYYIPQ